MPRASKPLESRAIRILVTSSLTTFRYLIMKLAIAIIGFGIRNLAKPSIIERALVVADSKTPIITPIVPFAMISAPASNPSTYSSKPK